MTAPGSNHFQVRPTGESTWEPAYCLNVHRAYPTALGSEGANGLPTFRKSDDPSDLTDFTDKKGADLTQKLLKVMWVGYPNDATGAVKKGHLTADQLRNATQNAIWHLTDGYDAAHQLSGDALKAYKVMIGESQSETLTLGTKFELKNLPEGAKLNVYVPTDDVAPPSNYKQWQNLLSSQFVDENDKPVTPEEPGTPDGPGSNEKTVKFEKLDKGTKAFVAGAKLRLEPQSPSQTINGKSELFVWESSAAAQEINMSPGEYLLKELQAPQGYKPINQPSFPIAQIVVADDGGVTVNTQGDSVVFRDGAVKIFNESLTPTPKGHDVVISKTDIAGKEIAGAEIEIWTSGDDAKKVEGWTSVEGESKTVKLTEGEYVFKETAAPEGYKVVSDITFTVDKDGKVTTTDVQQTVDGKKVATADGGKLTVINEAEAPKGHDVVISKTDIAGKEIAGAEIEIWTSGDDAKKVEGWTSVEGESKTVKLTEGEYVFKETAAPEGYKVVSDITFTVDKDGKVTTTDVQQTVDGKKVATADGGKLTVINEADDSPLAPGSSTGSLRWLVPLIGGGLLLGGLLSGGSSSGSSGSSSSTAPSEPGRSGSSTPSGPETSQSSGNTVAPAKSSEPQSGRKILANTGVQLGAITLLASVLIVVGMALVMRRKES
ncbi:SpaA isopeptide-forming pilin-related protein [Corynebacterium macclintockiae]|uniref:MSCRAMM family protein n=1 Tax=Corynebacterium macclintockiae TaxID=2913501 RepID=UPI003EBFEE47